MTFAEWKEGVIGKLPPPQAAFGLSLSGMQVTDAGLKELARLQALQKLDLFGAKVTDAGLKELAGLKALQCNLFNAPPSVMLSNRYRRTHDIDQDFYTTIITEGRAVFRTDRLLFLGAVPDDFRSYLMQPLPSPSMKRVSVQTVAEPEGNAVSYRIVDKELHLTVVPPSVTRIEAFQTVSCDNPNIEGGAGAAMGAVQKIMDSFGKKAFNPMQAVFGILGSFGDAIPMTRIKVVCRVWGQANSFRDTLHNVAIDMVRSRMASALGANLLAASFAGRGISLTHDLAGSYVEVVATLKTALTATALVAGGPLSIPVAAGGVAGAAFGAVAFPPVNQFFPTANDDTIGPTVGPILQRGGISASMDLPADVRADGTGARGTHVSRLVAAALLGQCGTPPSPTVPPPMTTGTGVSILGKTPP
jgi:hypothetical protein